VARWRISAGITNNPKSDGDSVPTATVSEGEGVLGSTVFFTMFTKTDKLTAILLL
jgi:hypothetical protein